MTTLILCAGQQLRMTGLDRPKQLLAVAGETILGRQLRMLRELHDIDPFVVTGNSDIRKATSPSQQCIDPEDSRTILHSLLSTRNAWTDRVHVLLGDVLYSPELLRRIVTELATVPRFYFRGAEIFGLSFGAESISSVVQAITDCFAESIHEYRGVRYFGDLRLWHLLRRLSGLPVHEHRGPIRNDMTLPEVDDWTTDVDSVRGYHDLVAEIESGRVPL